MSASPAERLLAFDRMRGIVMALMAVDHASAVFSADKFGADAYAFGAAGAELPSAAIFLTRWVTHLCAPTFVFLAGAALALSVEKRIARGDSARQIDSHLLARGLILIALEVWFSLNATFPLLQVLFAIGGSILCMIALRRLPNAWIASLAVAWIVCGEWLTAAVGYKPTPSPLPMATPTEGMLFTMGFYDLPFEAPAADPFAVGKVLFLYPILPWLAAMMLGWSFGRWIAPRLADATGQRQATRLLLVSGTIGLLAFVVQRLCNGYGNYWLPVTDDNWLRWLQVSKYPPSLAFYALELGLMAWILAALMRMPGRANSRGPLIVFGQTALFFYLLHAHLMWAFRIAVFGWDAYRVMAPKPWGLESAWIGAAATMAALYPLCLWYRGVKRRNPNSVLRFF